MSKCQKSQKSSSGAATGVSSSTSGRNSSVLPPYAFMMQPPLQNCPQMLNCPVCKKVVVSDVTVDPGRDNWIACALCACCGLCVPCIWMGFCFIPLCIDALKDYEHRCHSCGHVFGTKRIL